MNERRFGRRDVLGLAAGGTLLGTALKSSAFAAPAEPPKSTSRPNLVLFFIDECRADALATYGNPVCKTPSFDLLAKQGTRFAECHVQFTVCAQSRCSLLTGWPTSIHGHRSLYYLLRPDEPNLFRYLKEGGYDVFWFGKNDALARETFPLSVTRWEDKPFDASAFPKGAFGAPDPAKPNLMLFPGGVDRRKTPDYALLQDAITILERREQDRPFCIFLPLLEPHPPYMAPAGFDRMYKPADLPPLVPPGLPGKPHYHAAIRKAFALDRASDADLRQVRATYYAQVSYADWMLGELMEAMERTGRVRDTVLVASSDHGDYAGDYGLIEKWPSGLETCLTRVPLIARMPGGKAGHVAPEMVELFDIMATFLDLAKIEARHTHFARSFVPQLSGAAGDPERAAFSEAGYDVFEPQAFEPKLPGLYAPKTNLQNDDPRTVCRAASIKTADFNYVARPEDQSELYDRQADPMETRNLIDSAAHAEVGEAMRLRLMNRYIETTGIPPMDKDSREMPPFPPGSGP